jgi:hypothetical protein
MENLRWPPLSGGDGGAPQWAWAWAWAWARPLILFLWRDGAYCIFVLCVAWINRPRVRSESKQCNMCYTIQNDVDFAYPPASLRLRNIFISQSSSEYLNHAPNSNATSIRRDSLLYLRQNILYSKLNG